MTLCFVMLLVVKMHGPIQSGPNKGNLRFEDEGDVGGVTDKQNSHSKGLKGHCLVMF